MRGRHANDRVEVKARLARAAAASRPPPPDGGAAPATTARLRQLPRLADLTPVPGPRDLLLGPVPVRGEVVAVTLRATGTVDGRIARPR